MTRFFPKWYNKKYTATIVSNVFDIVKICHFQLIQKTVLLTTIFSVSSRTFLVLLHNAKADEWENITGASLASIVSLDVFRELCDRSIIMPSRFNSFITVCEKKNFVGCNLMLGLFHCSNPFMLLVTSIM